MNRRSFVQMVGGLSTIGLIEPGGWAHLLSPSATRLSKLAYQTPSAEGAWKLTKIEGLVPKDLIGTLYRVAGGQKVNHGVPLRHLFDGDAFVSAWHFRNGAVDVRAKFLSTPSRREEMAAGRMLYSEYGTPAPTSLVSNGPQSHGRRNNPNINVLYWDQRLLAFSEGGHPTALDSTDLSYRGSWDFYGTLPADMTFTAHPKIDPVTGVGYGYGIRKARDLALTVYRMEPNGKLTELYSLPQRGFFMIHDMMLSKEHLVFVVPPVHYDIGMLFSGAATPADALRYAEKEPTRYIVLRRDGKGTPITIEQPPSMVYHHGNAFEADGRIVLHTLPRPDGAILQQLFSWSKDQIPDAAPTHLTRLTLNLEDRKVESRTEFASGQEYPRFDIRKTGVDARYLYTLGFSRDDPFVLDSLACHDLHHGTSKHIQAAKGRAMEEAIFVPHPGQNRENRGWLLMQGFDAHRDENYLEIRDAGTLEFECRIWAGQHFPLGFHGNFNAS